jgi:hypothetical protein
MNYQTVFDVARVNPWDGWIQALFLPVFFIAISLIIVIAGPSVHRRSSDVRISVADNKTVRENEKSAARFNRIIAGIFCGTICLIVTSVMGASFMHHCQALEYLKHGPHQKVEGVVSQFDPMPASGHKNESFRVNGIPFAYSDFDMTNPGFRNATSHGGPIKEGLPVRIWYMPAPQDHPEKANWISRLDTAAVGNQSF